MSSKEYFDNFIDRSCNKFSNKGLRIFLDNVKKGKVYNFAYVFERFPSFTQTFCVREVAEMINQGVNPLIFSIRDTRDEKGNEIQYPKDIFERVIFLPPKDELVKCVKKLKDDKELPREAAVTLRLWGDKSDKMRVYESSFIGYLMKAASVKHAHCHFAGLAARTCWMIKKFYGFSYSFTGHANDIFCKDVGVLGLKDLIEGASLVATVSNFSEKKLNRNVPGYEYKIKRVYNGIDVEPFGLAYKKRMENYSSKKNESKKVSVIFSIGRLIEKKGFDDLINACALLKSEEKHKFRCIIVGDGPLKKALGEQIETLGLSSDVFLLGDAPQQFILDQFCESDLFILAAKKDSQGGMDNLPTVIMEAMAAGLPCISTTLAGIPEMIASEVTGLLVKNNHPDEIAKAMSKMLENPDDAIIMGRAGLNRAKKYFSKEFTTSQLIKHIFSEGRVNFSKIKKSFDQYKWDNYKNRFLKLFGVKNASCHKSLYDKKLK